MNITINTHSSIRVQAEKILYFDPFRIEKEPHDADLVFVTHAHFDHFSPDDLTKIAAPATVFVFPESMKKDAAEAGIPAERSVFLLPGDRVEVCGIPVEAVPSYNIGKPMHPKKNGWLGYLVTADGTRVYVSGDTDAVPEAKETVCDTALLPIGGTYTMNAKEAAALVNAMTVRPKTVIPTHYGSIVGSKKDADAFASLVDPAVRTELLL